MALDSSLNSSYEPVCEAPNINTSCAEPKNAVFDVKCEKTSCEIK
jgi:hypothetical protein